MAKPKSNDVAKFVLKDSGRRQRFFTGAVRDVQAGKGRFDLIPAYALLRVARVYEVGAAKYSENNWRKGIPLRKYIDSALRHIFAFAEGQRDEDHAAQAAWNLLCLIETEEMIRRSLLPAKLNNLLDYTERRRGKPDRRKTKRR